MPEPEEDLADSLTRCARRVLTLEHYAGRVIFYHDRGRTADEEAALEQLRTLLEERRKRAPGGGQGARDRARARARGEGPEPQP